MKKYFQNSSLQQLDAIRQEINQLAQQGIQVPDNIKLLNDPEMARVELEKVKSEAGIVVDTSEQIEDMADKAFLANEYQLREMRKLKNMGTASMKPFNLKKAQLSTLDTIEPQVQETAPKFSIENIKPSNVDEFIDRFLDQTDYLNAKSQLLGFAPEEVGTMVDDTLKSYYETDWSKIEDARTMKIQKVLPIWKNISSAVKGEQGQTGVLEDAEFQKVRAFVEDINGSIKKIAESDSKKNKKYFNLRKEAQAKTVENVIMYGPTEKRFDPFLRQPISDWHIVERNKGFGLVVDDVWNIDWESIWRGNIMDKYSRPYRDTKTGEWIGGYIQKRFEVDKWIPKQNNLQLLPGQRRKPYLPEHGIIEARLENMREKEGEKRGYKPTTEGKVFNWKKAQAEKKKLKLADINNPKVGYDEDITQIASELFVNGGQTTQEAAKEYIDSGRVSPEEILFKIKGLSRNDFLVPFGDSASEQPNLRFPSDIEDRYYEAAIKEVSQDLNIKITQIEEQDIKKTAENKKKIKMADLPAEDRKPKGSSWLDGEKLTQIVICTICNSRVAASAIECPNCHSRSFKNLGVQNKERDRKGISPQPVSTDIVVQAQNVSLPKKKKRKVYKGEEIKMLSDPFSGDKNTEQDEINQSMTDLCVDD